jgi:DtxR family Mn-dependent transcriptional regulator
MKPKDTLILSESLEDYLEAIFHLVQEHKVARAKQVADRMNVSKSSVTAALNGLAREKLINYEPYQFITLTSEGENVARTIAQRHRVLRGFLRDVLGVSEKEADEAACRLEHAIRGGIFERFMRFVDFLGSHPSLKEDWKGRFDEFCGDGSAEPATEETPAPSSRDESRPSGAASTDTKQAVGLDTLKPGSKGTIIKVRGRGPIRKRIADMGVVPGVLVEMERVAPLGDPLEIKLLGYHLSLRKEEAAGITVQPLE